MEREKGGKEERRKGEKVKIERKVGRWEDVKVEM